MLVNKRGEKNMVKDLENEIWKNIPGYEGRYKASNKGRIKSLIFPDERIVKPFRDRNGYNRVALSKYNDCGILKQRLFSIHRVVLLTFNPNENAQFLEINHIDGNKSNNCIENLEWCTRSENMKHAFENGLIKNNTGPNSYLFCQFDKKGNLIRKWKSVQDCAFFLSYQGYGDEQVIASNIWACLNNRFKSCCGFLFGYEDHIDAESKLSKARMSVLAYPVKGHKGSYEISGEPIRFRTINETEGYIMPNGKTAYATLVAKCCKGKRDTHAGYKWRYEKR